MRQKTINPYKHIVLIILALLFVMPANAGNTNYPNVINWIGSGQDKQPYLPPLDPISVVSYKNNTDLPTEASQTAFNVLYEFGGYSGTPWAIYSMLNLTNLSTDTYGAASIYGMSTTNSRGWSAAVHGQALTQSDGVTVGLNSEPEYDGGGNTVPNVFGVNVQMRENSEADNQGAGVNIQGISGTTKDAIRVTQEGGSFTNLLNYGNTLYFKAASNGYYIKSVDNTPFVGFVGSNGELTTFQLVNTAGRNDVRILYQSSERMVLNLTTGFVSFPAYSGSGNCPAHFDNNGQLVRQC